MTLEDFEKELAASKRAEEEKGAHKSSRSHREHREHRHDRPRAHRRDEDDDRHRRKRRRRSPEDDFADDGDKRRHRHRHKHERDGSAGRSASRANEENGSPDGRAEPEAAPQRDAWMEAPLEVEYVNRRRSPTPDAVTASSRKAEFELKIHENELNKHVLAEHNRNLDTPRKDAHAQPAQREVDYTFGDAGTGWRMTRLRGVYRQAEESGQSIEAVAERQYGDLRAFDDAREEELELDRRKTYGEGYVGKEKPSGELFQERQLKAGVHREKQAPPAADEPPPDPEIRPAETAPPASDVMLDQTALNRLKARMMKAQLRKAPDAAQLAAEYQAAAAAFVPGQRPQVITLGAMDSRDLAGGARPEVRAVDNKRGRERGTVTANEDMSIDDMVREERRTRGQAGGEGRRFAERIAKDGRFDNDLDYMDDNAGKLAQRMHKSEVNLRNVAIQDYQRVTRILDRCPLCAHEDRGAPPVAPVVALGTRVYLTLPPEPEIAAGSACIVPVQHRKNLLECDDDEWEEIRNFMKALTRAYHARGQLPLFHENAARPRAYPHALMHATPLPAAVHATAPGFFREAILAQAPEWAQHRKLLDTRAAARERGLGRNAFRRTLAKEMPYFHVWFELDGGLGHVVEDEGGDGGEGDEEYGGGGGGGGWRKWPPGDRFAREVLGGMLGVETMGRMRREGRWGESGGKEGRERMERWKTRWSWDQWDWTKALVQE